MLLFLHEFCTLILLDPTNSTSSTNESMYSLCSAGSIQKKFVLLEDSLKQIVRIVAGSVLFLLLLFAEATKFN